MTSTIEVRAELFRTSAADASALHFVAFAAADDAGDADGNVTLEELAEVDAPEPDVPRDELPELLHREGDGGGRELGPPETMADLLYEHLFPRVMRRAGGGACAVQVRSRSEEGEDDGGP